jgi:hypothetical protein
LKQRNPGSPVGIVLNLNDLSWHPELAALEVDRSVTSLMPATSVPHTDVPVVVAATTLLEGLKQ